MKKPFLLTSTFVATVAGVSIASLLAAQPSLAQITQESFPNVNSDQNTDPFSSNSNNFNPLDLIHRANLGTANWNNTEKTDELNSEAAAFRARQQKLIPVGQQPQFRGQQQVNPNSSVITAPVVRPQSNTLPSNN
jgi:hypothetical protein